MCMRMSVHPMNEKVNATFNRSFMDGNEVFRCEFLSQLQASIPDSTVCLKGGMGARLSIQRLLDELCDTESIEDRDVKRKVLDMFAPSDFDIFIIEEDGRRVDVLSRTVVSELRKHVKLVESEIRETFKAVSLMHGVSARLDKLRIQIISKTISYPGVHAELHRIVVIVPTNQGNCVCDYIDVAIPLTGDKIFEGDTINVDESVCFNDQVIKHPSVCMQMQLLKTAAWNWRLGRIEFETKKYISRFLVLRALCGDTLPIPVVENEELRRQTYITDFQMQIRPIVSWIRDKRVDHVKPRITSTRSNDSSDVYGYTFLSIAVAGTSIMLAALPIVVWRA